MISSSFIHQSSKNIKLRPFWFSLCLRFWRAPSDNCLPALPVTVTVMVRVTFVSSDHGKGSWDRQGYVISRLWAAKCIALIQTQVHHSLWCGWDKNQEEETSQSIYLISSFQVCQTAFFSENSPSNISGSTCSFRTDHTSPQRGGLYFHSLKIDEGSVAALTNRMW